MSFFTHCLEFILIREILFFKFSSLFFDKLDASVFKALGKNRKE